MTKKKLSLAEHARATRSGSAAYVLVDISQLDKADRKVLVEDANAGGGTYGLRVVEHAVNGAATAPLYGYYKDDPDAERWTKTKADFGLEANDVGDDEVIPSTGLGIEVTDPRREAALREAAAQAAEDEAQRIRSGEQEAIREIAGEDDEESAARLRSRTGRPTGTDHTVNIVDPGLARDATNEAAEAGPSEDNDEEGNTPTKAKKTRTPR